MNKLAIVVPCYNEEAVLPETNRILCNLMEELQLKGKITPDSAIVYVDDGSRDRTWELIQEAYRESHWVRGIRLTANTGHQNALFGGLMTVRKEYDVTVSIDADLQDDILVIEEMLDKYAEGYDIVYGVRNDRTTDTRFKRTTAQGFYRMMRFFGVKSVYNHADFRLMSSRALDVLSRYKERHLFLRGLVPLVGFNAASVYYKRKKRMAGESKYPLKKMISFAIDGVTSFSVKPITLISILGSLTIIISIIMMIYSAIQHLIGNTVSGWTSLIISLWFLGSIQLLSLGVVGSYVGKIYMQTKERPRYQIWGYLTHKESARPKYPRFSEEAPSYTGVTPGREKHRVPPVTTEGSDD